MGMRVAALRVRSESLWIEIDVDDGDVLHELRREEGGVVNGVDCLYSAEVADNRCERRALSGWRCVSACGVFPQRLMPTANGSGDVCARWRSRSDGGSCAHDCALCDWMLVGRCRPRFSSKGAWAKCPGPDF